MPSFSTQTDAQGVAMATFQLPTAATTFSQFANASVADLPIVVFSATATPGNPYVIRRWGGDTQTGVVGTTLPFPATVEVIDRNANRIVGVTVSWTPDVGSVSPVTSVTGSDGLARTNVTLPSAPSRYYVHASALNLTPAQFTFTAVPPDAE